MQDEVHERLVLVFADVLNKRLRRELFALFVGGQPILGEPIVEFADNCKDGGLRIEFTRMVCQGEPGLPSMANCSEIFGRSEPPTNPMATFFRNSDRSSSITGDTLYAVRAKNVTDEKAVTKWRVSLPGGRV